MKGTPDEAALEGLAARLGEPARDPADAVSVERIPVRSPGPGEVRVRMRFAPVNPADLNVLQGTYGRRPEPPATPGIEGAGTIDALGQGVAGLRPGDPVFYLADGMGTWSTHLVVPTTSVFPLPVGIDLRQAAMLRVNPATADRMLALTDRTPGEEGAVVFNAANSGVGRCLLQLARAAGRRAAAFLRDPGRFPELAELAGPDGRLFEDSDAGAREAEAWLGEDRPTLALNAVGGESALRLMTLLARGGLHVTYGAMGRQPLKVPNRFLIFDDLRLTGFWLTRWFATTAPRERDAVYHRLAERVAAGTLSVPVEKTFPLSEVREAVACAGRPHRTGKILLEC